MKMKLFIFVLISINLLVHAQNVQDNQAFAS